jgi:hypothetical protein
MRLGKTEQFIICKIAGWNTSLKPSPEKRHNNAVASLKRKDLIFKDEDYLLKFTDKGFKNMSRLKQSCARFCPAA